MRRRSPDTTAVRPKNHGERVEERAMPANDADATWDDRLLPLLSDTWQSADVLASRVGANHFTVLARLKDMLRRNLAERRIVPHATKKHAGRPLQQAEFRRTQL